MRILLNTLFLSALLHSPSASIENDGATQSNNRRIIEQQRYDGEVQMEPTFNIPDEDDSSSSDDSQSSDTKTIPILAHYDRGSSAVLAMDVDITMHMKKHGIIAGNVSPETMEALEKNPSMKVERDHKVWALEENHVGNLRRRLNENEPYGIPMVLQDMDFWSKLGEPSGSIKVCVADTGYDLGHVDLPQGDNVAGTSNPEYPDDEWDDDPHGHGTHCSGTVAAIGGNDKGVVGVIPNNMGGKFQLIIANALRGSGSGSTSGVMKAVDTCVDNGAKVVSLSLGGSHNSSIAYDFYNKLYKIKISYLSLQLEMVETLDFYFPLAFLR